MRPHADKPDGRLAFCMGSTSFALEPGRLYRIGASAESDLRINHASVAEHHAGVSTAGDSITIEDLGSEVGITVNGRRVRRATLKPGDVVQVGAISLELVAARGAAKAGRSRAAGPAAVRPAHAVPVGPVPLAQRYRQQDFQSYMAEELRRAPWFLLSAAIHAAGLLLLWFFLREPGGTARDPLQLTMSTGEYAGEIETEEAADEGVVVEEETLEDPLEEPVEPVELEGEETEEDDRVEMLPDPRDLLDAKAGLLTKVKKAPAGDILRVDNAKLQSGGFGRKVAKIRRSGLEIVFVFDSTGSMASVLSATKERIGRMVEVLHALVPNSRIGVITYRDHGNDEEYLTRNVPLGRDFYRVINFMHVIDAAGGGDPPEAVLDGLQSAFRQAWSPRARRVVVLIGDAPPHGHSHRDLEQRVRAFAEDGRSCIHAIVTAPNGSGGVPRHTQRQFRRIARDGRGECLSLEDAQITRRVLSLAFGSEYDRNIDEAFAILSARNAQIPSRIRAIVERNDPREVQLTLQDRETVDDLVRALVATRDTGVLRTLVGLAGDAGLREPARHAISFILQQALGLYRPPVDPVAGGPIDAERQRRLLALLER